MVNNQKKYVLLILTGLTITFVGLFLALSLGVTHLSFNQLFQILQSKETTLDVLLIQQVRLPRVLSAFMVGGLLALSGALIQGVTRNPIAEPSILGVSQGAIFTIALFLSIGFAINPFTIFSASLIGSVISLCFVSFLLYGQKQRSMTSILLAGTAISTLFISLTTIIGLITNQAQMIAFWVGGGFRNVIWVDFYLVFGIALISLIISVRISHKINIFSLGDEVALSLGINPRKLRLHVLLIVIPMIAGSVAVGKNIPFVGLIMPQIIRLFMGSDYRKIIPLSFLFGGILTLFADLLARLVFSPYEMPIGVFTAIIGIPFFIRLALKEKG